MEIELPYNYNPRTYQLPVWEYFQGNEEGKRGVCVWHRRAGKDLMAINLIATKLFQRVGVYWHLLPTYRQGRAIVWNGFTREGRRFLDYFPNDIIKRKSDNEMRIHFVNESIYQVVGTDDVNSLIGTNPIGCVFSEYSVHNPSAWEYIRPILAENGGWALFVFTPRGRNHGWKMKNDAAKAGWFYEERHAGDGDDATKRDDGTPVISDEQIQQERLAGMPEEMIQQEFYVSFESSMVGAYYSKQMTSARKEGRITNVPYDPKLKVNTYWDIGVGDSTVIVFAQTYGMEHRIIDCYENSGEGLVHYIKVLKEKDYLYGEHYAPWDIEVREFSSGRSRFDVARKLGIRFKITPQYSREDGIEQVRNVLPSCWFDKEKTEDLIDGLHQYHKEWDEVKRVFKDTPLHDWSSHYADAMRTFAWNVKRRNVWPDKPPQERALDDYAYV